MPEIALLSQETIDKIAAGEVVERPSSVVKELVENAIDAGATAVTVEIKEGGISFIRITDNGCGIARSQIALAFLRHSTSKIRGVEDLFRIRSLGFRGEALSSIAAVSQVELITKVYGALTGTRYVIEGSKELTNEEVGAPDGTTFIVRNLFYNTPARRKFLKSAQTEGNYIGDLMERLALSHPGISFQFINNGQTKLHTSGNSNEKDLVYHIYGRDITAALLPIEAETELFSVRGFLGKPTVSRGNRNYENFFVNERYIRSNLFSKAVEDAYKGFLMQRQYPFCVLYVQMDTELLDVNVHPTKMELRFSRNEEVYRSLYETVRGALSHKEMIPGSPAGKAPASGRSAGRPAEERTGKAKPLAEDAGGIASLLGGDALAQIRRKVTADSPYEPRYGQSERNGGRVMPGQPAGGLPGENGSAMPSDAGPGQSSPAMPSDARPGESGSAQPAGSVSGQSRPAQPDLPENLDVFESLLPGRKKPGEGEQATAGEESRTARPTPPADQPAAESAGYAAAGQPAAESAGYAADGQSAAESAGYAAAGGERFALREERTYGQYEQQSLAALDPGFLTEEARKRHRIIGQLFDTYWLVEYDDKLFVIDQHAAHEKVLYERTMERVRKNEFTSQALSPPIILTLSLQEQEALERCREQIEAFGYGVEPFGGKEFAVTAVPADFEAIDMKAMFVEMLDDFSGISGREAPELILEKVASLSCKAAVKGGNRLSRAEAEALIDELLTLENPYHCPHGRPTIVSMSRYEIEKKFKRIVN